jgi:hypothetical protein
VKGISRRAGRRSRWLFCVALTLKFSHKLLLLISCWLQTLQMDYTVFYEGRGKADGEHRHRRHTPERERGQSRLGDSIVFMDTRTTGGRVNTTTKIIRVRNAYALLNGVSGLHPIPHRLA